MIDTLDLRPPQRNTRGMIGVPTTLTASLLDADGEPKEAEAVDLYIGGPTSASWPLPDPLGDVTKITGTLDEETGLWTGSLWIGAMSDGSHRTSLQLPGGLGSSFSPASNAPAWLSLRSAGGVGWLYESTHNPHMMGFRADKPERWPGVPFSVGEALDLLADGLRRFASTAFVEDPPGTIELSPGSGPWMQLTLDGNKTIGLAAAGSYNEDNALELWIIQDGSGGHTVTWDSAIKWPGGTPPTLPTGANARSLIEFRSIDEGVTWYGMPKGLDFS